MFLFNFYFNIFTNRVRRGTSLSLLGFPFLFFAYSPFSPIYLHNSLGSGEVDFVFFSSTLNCALCIIDFLNKVISCIIGYICIATGSFRVVSYVYMNIIEFYTWSLIFRIILNGTFLMWFEWVLRIQGANCSFHLFWLHVFAWDCFLLLDLWRLSRHQWFKTKIGIIFIILTIEMQ